MKPIKDFSHEEVNHEFARLTDEQLDHIATDVLDDCYSKNLCHELGINYCDIRIIDMMKIYLNRAYIQGFLREG